MIWFVRKPENERILTYAPGTKERKALLKKLEELKSRHVEIPVVVGKEELKTDESVECKVPHNHSIVLGKAYLAGEEELKEAISVALEAWQSWSELDWYHRAAVFLRAAELLAKDYRIEAVAAIMLAQSKNPYEAEIDLAELVDFWRFNAYYMRMIYEHQPDQHPGEANRIDWRPLEGFILAITPFNFFSIAGNLPTAPAMVGNVALWKPSLEVIYSNFYVMKVLREAGLPPGVVNFVPFRHELLDVVISDPNLAGLHFTGSTKTFKFLWRKLTEYLDRYKNFPRIVGETGGKDFIVVHPSADLDVAVAAIVWGGLGYQGQKCSAASRVYVPESLWDKLKERLIAEAERIKVGPVEDLENYMGALISEKAFKKVVSHIEYAKSNEDYEIVYGGKYDSSRGWFVWPTFILAKKPKGKLMEEEIFGPVITFYIYRDEEYEDVLRLCAGTSPYGLTGSIIARDRDAIVKAERILRYAAGNFYINDKPTGAIVGRQPFGGSRASGTNDKAGWWLNLLRWLTPRTIKENFSPPRDWRPAYLQKC